MLSILIIICSVLGIIGAVLNCTGRLKYSYMVWGVGNAGWIIITYMTGGNVATLLMWGVYFSTSVIGLRRY